MSPPPTAPENGPNVIVVLGCRFTESGPGAALTRRLRRAAELATELGEPLIVLMSGGAGPPGHTEAEVMARWWAEGGHPGVVWAETQSNNTRENARRSRELLARAAIARVHLVTCDSHLPRALREFERVGLEAQGYPAPSPHGPVRRLRADVREWIAARLTAFLGVAFLFTSAPGCDYRSGKDSEEHRERLSERTVTVPLAEASVAHLRQAAREPLPSDQEMFARALLESGPVRKDAALGLGQLCSEPPSASSTLPSIESLLEMAASLWALSDPPPTSDELQALALALGQCGTERAERALLAWLDVPRDPSLAPAGRAAASGLAALASRRGGLSERTLARLLDKAETEKSAVFLAPIGRITRLPRAVAERTIDVAGKILTARGSDPKRDAIFALGSAGPRARGALSATVLTKTYRLNERTAALATLARLGKDGQEKLDELSLALLEQGIPKKATDPAWVLLLAALDALEKAKVSSDALDLVRKGPLPPQSTDTTQKGRLLAAQRRRLILLRCRAAEIQAGTDWNHKLLRTCDPESGSAGKLALLRALDRTVISGDGRRELVRLLDDPDPVVRTAALALFGAHRELAGDAELFLSRARAGAPEQKVVALRAIAAHPERFMSEAEDDGAVPFVRELLLGTAKEPFVELAALDAAGALGQAELRPSVERYCHAQGPHAFALGRAARRALALLGKTPPKCEPRWLPESSPAAEPVEVSMMSDLGPLSLTFDLIRAPHAARQVLDLFTKSPGGPVRAARPGSLLEWAPIAPAPSVAPLIPNELELLPPKASEFGIGPAYAQGAPVLFFAVSDAPELAGQRIILGHATGPFELFVMGDFIDPVQVEKPAAFPAPRSAPEEPAQTPSNN